MRVAGKYLCFLFLVISPFFAHSQRCDSIEWSAHHHLKWKYFKGKPDKKSTATALSEPHIYYECSITSNFAKLLFSCSFSTCDSWVKGKGTKKLLQHEQTHFDIAEYYMRSLVKEILRQKFSANDVLVRVKAIGDQVKKLRRESDELYDLDTNHSLNEQRQKEWTKKVNKMIRGLDDFDKASYIISLK